MLRLPAFAGARFVPKVLRVHTFRQCTHRIAVGVPQWQAGKDFLWQVFYSDTEMQKFECDKCGACCKGRLIVEADDLDVMREPRLIEADPQHAGMSVEETIRGMQQEWKAVILACGHPCAFLGQDNLCTIYPSRPNCCVAFEAGDEQCQEARAAEGLPPLLPVE